MTTNFTQFAVTSLVAEDGLGHIALFTSDPESPQTPKAWLLTEKVDGVLWTDSFECLPKDADKM
jgi:hypothetical protein